MAKRWQDRGRRAGGALRSPLWWLSLAVAGLSLHPVWGRTQPLPAVAGAAMLLVAPGLLCALLQLRSWSAVVAVHVALAQLFIALQLSPALGAAAATHFGELGIAWLDAPAPLQLLHLWGLLASYLWVVPRPVPEPLRLSLSGPNSAR